MKKFRKTAIAVLSAVICAASANAMTGSCIYTEWRNDRSYVEGVLEKQGYVFVDSDGEFLAPATLWTGFTPKWYVYVREESRTGIAIVTCDSLLVSIHSGTDKDLDFTPGVESIVAEFDPTLEVKPWGDHYYRIYDPNAEPFDGRYDTPESLEPLYERLNEELSEMEIVSFDTYGHIVNPRFGFLSSEHTISIPSMTSYSYANEDDGEELYAKLSDYVSENKLDYTVESGGKKIWSLVPTREMALEEQVQTVKDIRRDLGLTIGCALQEDAVFSSTVDLCGVKGDANCDGKLTIADATAILQYNVNPDKYYLTVQGEYNADIYGDHDGVTPADALEVITKNAE